MLWALLLVALVLGACGDDSRVVVGAGTSIEDSGFMAELVDAYGRDLSVVGRPTAELLQLAGQGSLSVAIAHDEVQELAFVAEHPDVERREVFASEYLLVGPPDLVAQISATSPVAAFAEIAANGWVFVTRDDDSGTHRRELTLWEAAGTRPSPEVYPATGQGMGFTLQVTDQRRGFTLVESGAFVAARDTLDLEPIALDAGELLRNPYSALLIDDAGRPFFDWLTGPEGAAAVVAADAALYAETIYLPAR